MNPDLYHAILLPDNTILYFVGTKYEAADLYMREKALVLVSYDTIEGLVWAFQNQPTAHA